MRPGQSSPPLAFTANGLPGIVNARVEGDAEQPDIDALDDDDPRLTNRALDVTSVPLKVVGVVPAMANPTRAALIRRLRGLTQQTCTLGWTSDAQLCAALDADFTDARSTLTWTAADGSQHICDDLLALPTDSFLAR